MHFRARKDLVVMLKGGGVVTYTVDGKQYVAVSSGRPSGLNWRAGPSGAPNVMIFALPG